MLPYYSIRKQRVQVGLARPFVQPYMNVCTVISLLKIPYVHTVYTYKYMVLAHPKYKHTVK